MDYSDINSEAVQIKIHAYVTGTLTGEDLIEFEKALSENQPLVEEVEFSKQMIWVTENKDLFDVKHQLAELIESTPLKADYNHLEDFKPSSSDVSKNGWWLGGLILLAVLVSIYIFSTKQTILIINDQQQMMISETYIKPLENVIITDENYPSPMQDGMRAYDDNNYQIAVDNLSLYQQDDNAKLYLAISYQQLGQHEEAIDILEELVNSDLPNFVVTSKWYLSLSYLKTNKVDQAVKILKELTGHPIYKKRASELLAKLDLN